MTVFLDDGDVVLHVGDCLAVLRTLPDASVDCCVTSPPYWGLRDYGVDGQRGLEATPDEYVAGMVEVFREVRRVLTPRGTLWLNLGDSYFGTGKGPSDEGHGQGFHANVTAASSYPTRGVYRHDTLKPKDLVGVPWRVAFALQQDGWWLRSDVIWAKPNPMPESVTDRPTKAHEYVFLLTRAERYYYDADAIREPHVYGGVREPARGGWAQDSAGRPGPDGAQHLYGHPAGRNARSVWTIPTRPYPGAHFAVFPPEIPTRCIQAGCPEQVCRECGEPRQRITEREAMVIKPGPGRIAKQAEQGGRARTAVGGTMVTPPSTRTVGWTDCGHDAYLPGVVLDPFAGSGTTIYTARRLGRHAIGIELNHAYARLAAERLQQLSLLGGAA